MSWVKEKKKPVDLSLYDDIDEDLIVEGLTEDEIRELNAAIDPEVCMALYFKTIFITMAYHVYHVFDSEQRI